MHAERRSIFMLFRAAAAAAALILCEHQALVAEQEHPAFSHGGRARNQGALPSLLAGEGAHPSRSTFDTGPPRSASPHQGSLAAGSTPRHTANDKKTPYSGRVPRPGESIPSTRVQSPAKGSTAAKPQAPTSAADPPFSLKDGGADLSLSGKLSNYVPFAGATAPRSPASLSAPLPILEKSGLAGSPSSGGFPGSRSTSHGHKAAKGLSELLANVELWHQTADALNAMCERIEADTVATITSDELNVSCISKDCKISNEEHTRAKSAAMGEVCNLPSAEASADDDAAASENIRRHAKARMEQIFSANIKGKLIIAVGIPPNLLSIAQAASQVIVVEMDSKACEKFLSSKQGICTLRREVQYVCMKRNTLTPEEKALLAFETTEALVKRHFYEMPPDLLLVSSDYPVAVAFKLLEELDQSTTLIVHHRLSFQALQALAPRYRQELFLHPNMEDDDPNPRSLVLLRRTYASRVNSDYWREYLTPEWRLSPSEGSMKVLNSCIGPATYVLETAGEASADILIHLYVRTLRQFWALASDEERQIAKIVITSISNTVRSPGVTSTVVKDVFRVAAESAAETVMETLNMKYYLRRLEAKIKEVEATKRLLYQALYYELVVVLRKIETTDTQRKALRKLLRDVDRRLVYSGTHLPRLLHALRMAVETFNDVKDVRQLLHDTQQRCSLPSRTPEA